MHHIGRITGQPDMTTRTAGSIDMEHDYVAGADVTNVGDLRVFTDASPAIGG